MAANNKRPCVPPLSIQAGYIRIDGSVPSAERIQLVHKFQSDPETRVAILSIQAAGQVHTDTQSVTQHLFNNGKGPQSKFLKQKVYKIYYS